MSIKRISFSLIGVLLVSRCEAQVVEWVRQLGAGPVDQAFAVSADESGSIYMVGRTDGQLGLRREGQFDGFLAKYDSEGVFRWVLQNGLGEASPVQYSDAFRDVTISPTGMVYLAADYWRQDDPLPTINPLIAAIDDTDLPGVAGDSFRVAWSEFPPAGSHGVVGEVGGSIASDAQGNAYLGGRTFAADSGSDAFVGGYDAEGNQIAFQTLLPTALDLPVGPSEFVNDASFGVARNDSGHELLHLVGTSNVGGVGSSSAGFVVKLDSSNAVSWTAHFDSPSGAEFPADEAHGVAVSEDGSVYVIGGVGGNLHGEENAGGGADIFLTKFDEAGNRVWTRLYGGDGFDRGNDLEIDSRGNLYIAATTRGTGASPGAGDAQIVKLNADGDVLWELDLGSGEALGVSVSGNDVYVTGTTGIEMNRPYSPNGPSGPPIVHDAFLVKILSNGFINNDCDGDGIVTIADANCVPVSLLDAFLTENNFVLGDADGLAGVQFADFLTLSQNFSRPGVYTDGDFNKDGIIGFGDFLILSENFGKDGNIHDGGGVTGVPEPSTQPQPWIVGIVALARLLRSDEETRSLT